MFDPMSMLPEDWKTEVTRVAGGGRNRDGNWVDGTEVQVKGCVLSPGVIEEDGKFSDVTSSEARLFAPLDAEYYEPSTFASWTSGDTVVTPAGSLIPGTWQVAGEPVRWPGGWEIRISKIGGRNGSV